jgi:hypothetical protein
VTLVERVAGALDRHTSRRGFLAKTALVGSALAVSPVDFLLKPGAAYARVCRCANPACGCGSPCCDGYTDFCCTVHGSNTCPPGTFAGGWWKADGSSYCGGPRYYIDCHAECQCQGSCVPGGPAFCGPACDGLDCGCAHGDCGQRAVGCVSFRYGQCHEEIACAGRISCRVVTCTPAYLLDNSCSTTAMTDDFTAPHNAPCLQAPASVVRAYGSATAPGGGVWLVGTDGGVFAYGGAGYFGSMGGRPLDQPVVAMAGTPDGKGYWLVAADGGVFAFGSAGYHGSMGGLPLDAPIVGIAAPPDGKGYWLVAADGGVFAFGSAGYHGSAGGAVLTSPVVAMAPSRDGRGYWLVAADGGIFAYASAPFLGSVGGQALNAVMAGIVPTPTGAGYWLWGQDGSVYGYGDAPSLGSYRTLASPQPALPAIGIDAFYALVPSVGATGYTLWAASPIGPPPSVHTYTFAPAG